MQVLEAAPAAPVVVIADCPTSSHLPALLASPAWAPFRTPPPTPKASATNSTGQQHLNCIVHLAPSQVGPPTPHCYKDSLGSLLAGYFGLF